MYGTNNGKYQYRVGEVPELQHGKKCREKCCDQGANGRDEVQNEDQDLKERFEKVYLELSNNEEKVIEELLVVQGKAVDLGGYFRPDDGLAAKVMRPSDTFNSIIDSL